MSRAATTDREARAAATGGTAATRSDRESRAATTGRAAATRRDGRTGAPRGREVAA